MTRILFLWHELCSCDRNYVLLAIFVSFWQELYSWYYIIYCNGIYFWYWKYINYSTERYTCILLAGIIFFWQEIYSCDINNFLWWGLYSGKSIFFPVINCHNLFSQHCAGLPTKISCEILRFRVNLVDRLTGIIPPWLGTPT